MTSATDDIILEYTHIMDDLDWLTEEVNFYEMSSSPVRNILHVSYTPNIELQDEKEKKRLRLQVCKGLRQELENVNIEGVQLHFICREKEGAAVVYYYTRSGYSKAVQAQTLKYLFARFNEKHAKKGYVTFLLSHPSLIYLANAKLACTNQMIEYLKNKNAELEQRLYLKLKGVADAIAAPKKTLQDEVVHIKAINESDDENRFSTDDDPKTKQSPKRAK